MLKEVLEYLEVKPGKKFIDGTLGGASYTLALAKRIGPSGKVLSIDLDDLAIANASQKIKKEKIDNIVLVQDNFKNIKKIITDRFPSNTKFSGVVLDLGLSSAQLSDSQRAFSFKDDRPLEMSFGPSNNKSTIDIINKYSVQELSRIFKEYGEEKSANRLAEEIVKVRKFKNIKTSQELVRIIKNIIPDNLHSKINPATKVFQALRIETNEELSALEKFLEDILEFIEKNGRLVIVSFHSGEDRLVKNFFRNSAHLEILTKKPILAGMSELNSNPRARSAKLRVARLLV